MDRETLRRLLSRVRDGEVGIDDALGALSDLPFVDTPSARIDTHRALRHGLPEVVFGLGKSVDQIAEIVTALRGAGQPVLVTRVDAEIASGVLDRVSEGGEYRAAARLLCFGEDPDPEQGPGRGRIAVVSAGTADEPVAAEAAEVAKRFGNRVDVLRDVGVAGIHRLLASRDVLREARVVIAVAGMEGALPSVVGGLVDRPVIAVPTSVGYGASLGGLAALLGMLTSCASNVTVVNIDNGFGAAYVATLVNRL